MSSESESKDLPLEKRAELLAELFLEELTPWFLARAPKIAEPFDFLIGFKSPNGGVHTSFVEVKLANTPIVDGHTTLRVKDSVFDLITQSTPPVLLLLVDTKHSKLNYVWGTAIADLLPRKLPGNLVSVRIPVTEVTDVSKKMLLAELTGALPAANLAS